MCYKLAKYLNGYRIERTDAFIEVFALIEYLDGELAKENNNETIG